MKIFERLKKEYKVVIPAIAIIVLLIAVFYFYREYRYNNYRHKEEEKVYQYFSGIRTDYDLILTLNLKDIIVDIKPKNKTIYYDSTPVYYKKYDKVLFPYEMNAIFPLKEAAQYRLYKYSIYEYDDETYYLINNNQKKDYLHFFMYDGSGLFFFPYESILKIDGREDINLSSMSYVKIVTDTLIYYDKKTDKSEVIELNEEGVSVSSDDYLINIRERYFVRLGNKILLFHPEHLKSIDEMN